MASIDNYRRPRFPHRPWITGKLYDQYASKLMLHCDAYVIELENHMYLLIDWCEGGRKLIAVDAYLIEPDGLTPVWDSDRVRKGTRVFWGFEGVPWGPLHKRVLTEAGDMPKRFNQWARILVQCHYVKLGETDTEIRGERNKYKERKEYAPRAFASQGRKVPTMARKRAALIRLEAWKARKSGVLPDWL